MQREHITEAAYVREHEQEILSLLDKMGIAAWFTDKANVVDVCNKAACGLVDRSSEEMVGMSMGDEVVCEVDREAAKAVLGQSVSGEETVGTFMCLGHKDGSEVAVSVDTGPRRVRGEITGCLVLAQKQRGDVASFKLDMDGKVVDCNRKACELVGVERPVDVIGKEFVGDMVVEVGKEACSDAVGRAVGGSEVCGVATPLVGKDGASVWVDGEYVQRVGASGEV